jgi:hypothetical protein
VTEPNVRERLETLAQQVRRMAPTTVNVQEALHAICAILLDLPALRAGEDQKADDNPLCVCGNVACPHLAAASGGEKMAALRDAAQTNEYMADVLRSIEAGSGDEGKGEHLPAQATTALRESEIAEDRLQQQLDAALAILAAVVREATDYGTDRDGFVAAYVLPTGPIHRAIPFLEARGIVVRPHTAGRWRGDGVQSQQQSEMLIGEATAHRLNQSFADRAAPATVSPPPSAPIEKSDTATALPEGLTTRWLKEMATAKQRSRIDGTENPYEHLTSAEATIWWWEHVEKPRAQAGSGARDSGPDTAQPSTTVPPSASRVEGDRAEVFLVRCGPYWHCTTDRAEAEGVRLALSGATAGVDFRRCVELREGEEIVTRQQIIAGFYDAASVGITLIRTTELQQIRAEKEAALNALAAARQHAETAEAERNNTSERLNVVMRERDAALNSAKGAKVALDYSEELLKLARADLKAAKSASDGWVEGVVRAPHNIGTQLPMTANWPIGTPVLVRRKEAE